MTATEPTRVACKKADAQTTVAQTHYDARDTLAGRLDHGTVRQAVEADLGGERTAEPRRVGRTPVTTGPTEEVRR